MAVMKVLVVVALCTLGQSASFSLKKVREDLLNRQLRKSGDLVLPTVPAGLNPGDAGVQEWPDEFRPDIESAFELLKTKREASADDGDQQKPGGLFEIPSGLENYAKPFTGMGGDLPGMSQLSNLSMPGNPMGGFQNMTSMGGNPIGQYTNFTNYGELTNMPGNPMGGFQNMTSMGGNPIGQYTNFTNYGELTNMPGNPMGEIQNMTSMGGNPIGQYTNFTNYPNQIPGTGSGLSVPFINNGNNNNEGDKPSKRSADYSSQIPAVNYNKPLGKGVGTICNSVAGSAKE